MDAGSLVAAVSAGIPSVAAAWFAYRSSARANATKHEAIRLAAAKVDAEAYERAKAFWEKLLNDADRHIDRLQGQVDRLGGQVERLSLEVAKEQDSSNTVRAQLRAVGSQVAAMEFTIAELRNQLSARRAPNAGPA